MTDKPARVTPGEISDLLGRISQAGPDAPLAERIAWHERKASILSRIAADTGTPEAHAVAAEAWHHLSGLARQADAQDQKAGEPR